MTITDALGYFVALLLLAAAFLRTPAAVRGRRREQTLWMALAILTAAWLVRTHPVSALVDQLGVPDLAYLIKHALALTGTCVLLRYVTAAHCSSGSSPLRRARVAALAHRLATRACLATIALMTALFFAALDEPASTAPHFVTHHAGKPELALYLGLFYVYTAAAAAVCAWQWGGAARHATLRSLRIGLVMMATAMTTAVLYAMLRGLSLLLISVGDLRGDVALLQKTVTDSVLCVTFLLWGVGALAPASRAAQHRYRTLRDLTALHQLWRDLALTAPEAVLHQPSQLLPRHRAFAALNALRDVSSHDSTATVRLGRYVTEIRDVIQVLRRRAPAELAEASLAYAHRTGQDGDGAKITAEAYWLRNAQKAQGSQIQGSPAPFPFDAGGDFADEVPHLRAVASAYRNLQLADAQS